MCGGRRALRFPRLPRVLTLPVELGLGSDHWLLRVIRPTTHRPVVLGHQPRHRTARQVGSLRVPAAVGPSDLSGVSDASRSSRRRRWACWEHWGRLLKQHRPLREQEPELRF